MEIRPLNQIIEWVEARLGLKSHLISLVIWKDKTRERMAACRLLTYEEYKEYLETSPQEMQELIELVVNTETWFFREKRAFDYLIAVAKQIKMEETFFKVLSVACSTGEEPYSIAMALFQAGLSMHSFRVDALDISHQALIKARNGIYCGKSFREEEFFFRDRYFNQIDSGYAIKNKVKDQVTFYEGNVLTEEIPFEPQSYQVIFCRNLLIYLNQEAQMNLLNRMKLLLTVQGVLIVGSAETKIMRKAGFEPILFPSANAFRLKQTGIQELQKSLLGSAPIHKVKLLAPLLKLKSITEPLAFPSKSQETIHQSALLQEAVKKADAGAFEEALQLCLNYIRKYGAHADVYYLLGLIHDATGNEEEAKNCFHKAVYLEPSHYEALICLALLYEGQGERDKAHLFRQRALKFSG